MIWQASHCQRYLLLILYFYIFLYADEVGACSCMLGVKVVL